MRRKLFTRCSAVSLLLFVAACELWVRSVAGTSYASLVTTETLNQRRWVEACVGDGSVTFARFDGAIGTTSG